MLITIRHGRTDYNEKRVFSGTGDVPRLTKQAHLDAYELGKELKKYNLDIAIVSPLTRAKETFEELNKSLNIEMKVDDLLIERNFKDYEGKPIALLDPSIYWDMDNNSYEIEVLEEFANRIELALNKIKETYKDKNILIVAHSGVCRAIKYLIEGKVNRKWYTYSMENLKAYVYKEW